MSVVLLVAILIDWRYQISDTLPAYFEYRAAYVAEAAQSVRSAPGSVTLLEQVPPAPVYLNAKGTAFLPGPVETFRFAVPTWVLVDATRALMAAQDDAIAVLPGVAPGTRLVVIELYSSLEFGPAVYEASQPFVLEVGKQDARLTYAPTDQEFIYGSKRLTLDERLRRSDDPDSVVTRFGPKVSHSIGIAFLTMGQWRFPYLDLIRPSSEPTYRLLGFW